VTRSLPELSRFELQCLRALWARGEASVKDVQAALPEAPGYSTVRKIFERLEEKGAVERVRREGRAWIYRSRVSAPAMIRKEIRRLMDALFDGQAAPLVSHLADMNAISLADLKALESHLDALDGGTPGKSEAPARETDSPGQKGGQDG